MPAVVDKVSLIGSSNSRRAPAVTRPFHVLVTGHPPWAEPSTPRTCTEWCHAMQTTDDSQGTELNSPPHRSRRPFTATEVQQFTDAERPAMGHSGTEGRMTGTAPLRSHTEHGTRVMSLGVGTIRTGSERDLMSPDRNVLRKDNHCTEYSPHRWFVIA